MLPALPLFARDLFARDHVGIRMRLVGILHAKSRQAQIDSVFEILGQGERAVRDLGQERMGNAPTIAADTARNAGPFASARAHDVKCGLGDRDEPRAPRREWIQDAVVRLHCAGAAFDSRRERLEEIRGRFGVGIDDDDRICPGLRGTALEGKLKRVALAAQFGIGALENPSFSPLRRILSPA